jgi:hypothetical protein
MAEKFRQSLRHNATICARDGLAGAGFAAWAGEGAALAGATGCASGVAIHFVKGKNGVIGGALEIADAGRDGYLLRKGYKKRYLAKQLLKRGYRVRVRYICFTALCTLRYR